MASKIFEALLEEKIEIFKNAFKSVSKNVFWNEELKKLSHPGEYGLYREIICKEFIRYLIPRRLNIDTGFLINTDNKVSTQCDLIVYDLNSTPLIEDSEKQKFYPVESVPAVGEVKSVLSKSKFIETINKLAKIKQMKETITSPTFVRREVEVGPFDTIYYNPDGLFTFIICDKLDFDISDICNLITASYNSSVGHHNKHNLILSIEDGLLTYYFFDSKTKRHRFLPYPIDMREKLKNAFVPSKPANNEHFKHFAHYMFFGISNSSILHPETANYLHPLSDNPIIREK
jgi:hypothetical protein